MDPTPDPGQNGPRPDSEVVNLDELVAKPQKVILAGQEFELPTVTTKQLALFMRAQSILQRVGEGEPEKQFDVLVEACDEMDRLFPEVAERKPFGELAPVQLERIMELIVGMVEGSVGGKASRRMRRARARAGQRRQR